MIGLVLTASGAFKAEAVLAFTAPGSDSVLVRQMGQTLARTAMASDVVQSAEISSGDTTSPLRDRMTAKWLTDTELVVVSVTAATPDAAMRDANAIAEAVVTLKNNDVQTQLAKALNEFNAALKDQALENSQAEASRRTQLGASLALRQDAITAQSGKVTVLDAASVAGPAGLTRTMGLVIGAALGLLVAALISALLGVRGLRVRSAWTLRYLLTDWRIASPGQAAEIAGRIIESRKNAVAFIATEGTDEATRGFASEIRDCLEAHGRTVRTVDLIGVQNNSASLRLLRHDVRDDVDGELGSDLVLYTVNADSKAASLLQGQSNLRALVVARRRRTRVEPALRALKSFSPARPVLVLVR
jgi:capsular polysaccharide biosynthesis protein